MFLFLLSSIVFVPSLSYVSVILGARYDALIDIWSLGCMMFELLTGDVLFDQRSLLDNSDGVRPCFHSH